MRDLKIKTNTGIQCSTKQLAVAVCDVLHVLGYKWANGDSYTFIGSFEIYNSNTCYSPHIGGFGCVSFYKKHGYEIISAEEFLRLHGCDIIDTYEIVDFDLQKAMDGAELITVGSGLKARLICSDIKRKHGRLAVALMGSDEEHVHIYNEHGIIEGGGGGHLALKIVKRKTMISIPSVRKMTLVELIEDYELKNHCVVNVVDARI